VLSRVGAVAGKVVAREAIIVVWVYAALSRSDL
jgi:hypothetical protein